MPLIDTLGLDESCSFILVGVNGDRLELLLDCTSRRRSSSLDSLSDPSGFLVFLDIDSAGIGDR